MFSNLSLPELSGIIVGIVTVLGGLYKHLATKRDEWTIRTINERISEHNDDEKAHLAAIKLISEIMLKHNDDPKAHPNAYVTTEFTELQITLAGTLATISAKLDNLTVELSGLKSVHSDAVKAGLCIYQNLAKANYSNKRKSDPELADFSELRQLALPNDGE